MSRGLKRAPRPRRSVSTPPKRDRDAAPDVSTRETIAKCFVEHADDIAWDFAELADHVRAKPVA